MTVLRLIFMILLIAVITSCVHKADMDSLKAVSFSSDIQPILSGNCSMSGCHTDDHSGSNSGSNSGSHSGGNEDEGDDLFPLISYNDVMDHGDIKAGNARSSKLYQVVTNKGEQLMPPDPRPMLTDDQMKLIYVWIEQGAKDN